MRGRLAGSFALAVSLALPAASEAAWPGLNGRIALTQRIEAGPNNQPRANREIFAYALDGARTNLTNSRENDEQASWSPDGRWIAFKRRDAVFVQPLDGRPAWPLTTPSDDAVNNTQPAWSPDAGSILFRTNRAVAPLNVADVWVMDAPGATTPGGENQRPLVVRPGDERYPTFSPDGSRLAFRGDGDGIAPSGDEEIFVADADGSGVVQLTRDEALDSAPAWSPDGTRLAWESTRDGADREIYVMDADGTDVRRLTDNDVHDEGPAWSPDGRLIAFTRSPTADEPGDVWVFGSDGSGERRLTETPLIEESPDWQPLPFSVGPPAAATVACGDLTAVPGGVGSIVAVRMRCERARRLAAFWLRHKLDGPRTILRGIFACDQELHSFDQVVVECERARGGRGFAFVHRRAA